MTMANNLVVLVLLSSGTLRSTLTFHTPIITKSPSAFHSILSQTSRYLSSASNNSNPESIPSDKLIHLAKSFISNKNAAGSGESTLDGVFGMCSATVDLYGLKGDDLRPGLTSFFESHSGLHHELLEEPTVIGSGVVQYPFTKRWRGAGDTKECEGADIMMEWKSIDPTKPRDKVERLWFDDENKLVKVSVVEADASLD